jgi:hypothetical protein
MSAVEPLGSVFDAFYTRHVLRDVLCKMAPGASLLIGVRIAIWSAHQAIQDMNGAGLVVCPI